MSRSIRRPERDVSAYPQGGSPESPNDRRGGKGRLLTRRAALKALLGVSVMTAGMLGGPVSALAAEASKETTDKLNAAQAAYNDAKTKLDAISNEYVQLNQQLNDTVNQISAVQTSIDEKTAQISSKQDEIDAKQSQIDAKQDEIDVKQAELEEKQDHLANRMSSTYKSGGSSLLSILFNSASFEQFTSNLTYMTKVNQSDQELIEEVRSDKEQLEQAKSELEQDKAALEQDKEQLEQAKSELESQKAQLEQLKANQTQQLSAVQAKQNEATALVESLSDDVKALVAQRDAELYAAAEEERRQREAEEAARQQAAAGGGVTGSLSGASASVKGAAIVAACSRVGSPGAGLCAMWVSQVYNRAGLGYPGGNANNMYWNFCKSSNKGDLEPGMIVAVSSHSHTSAGRTYGHVGIYVGNGTVMDNVGYIRTIGLDSWISYYSDTVTPRWGWAA